MRRSLALSLMLLALPANAQQTDRDYLTAFLEDNLSDAGRQVVITGFTGALSSQAALDSLTIADDQGVWITLNGVVLDWSRSSLLSGQVVINELSAQEIILSRLPDTGDSDMPAAEAKGFSLPDLPVSVEIGRVAAERIVVDRAVFGQPVEGSLESALSLIGGEGKASFTLLRSDAGPDGDIRLEASYSNLSRELDLSLQAREGAGGLAVTLLGLPGAPSAELSVLGSGTFEDFAADILLATDGVERLGGKVTVMADEDGASRFKADVAGDLGPLFLPAYAEFFGTEVSLLAEGTRSAIGRLTLEALTVKSRALAISGSATIASDGLPEALSLTGRLAAPDGTPLLLPFGDVPTRVASADFDLLVADTAEGGWKGSLLLAGLDRPEFKTEEFRIAGSGRIGRTAAGNSIGATIRLAADGLLPTDPGLAATLGKTVTGTLTAHWLEGSGALNLSDLRIIGEGYQAHASLKVEGLEDAFLTSGRVEVSAEDFTRFSGLAGRPVGGSGTAVLQGSASQLSGFFDLTGQFKGQGLRIGVAELDRLLAGGSTVDISAIRDETGTVLRSLDLEANTLSVTANGKLSSKGSDLQGKLDLSDLAALRPGYRGRLALKAAFTGTVAAGQITATGTGTGLGIGQAEADRLLAGESKLNLRVAVADGVIRIDEAKLANPQLSLTAQGNVAGDDSKISLEARLANLALLLPEFPGPLTVSGTALQDATGYVIDLAGRGPGQVDAKVAGRVAADFATADLSLSGSGQAGLANAFLEPRSVSGPVRFDLRLDGPLRPSSLSGRLSLAGGRVTDASLGFALERVEAVADLSGGQARVSATTQLSSGGRLRIDGSVGVAAPNQADLSISLDRLRLVDPELYQTTASGEVTVTGPLQGGALIAGRITLDDTEIMVPSSGFGGEGGLPDLRHINEPREVRDTRAKAGLLGEAGSGGRTGGTGAFRLDLEISAPSRVFVRGRGIDAELGGSLRLTGTTAAIVPSGGFSLIRGRLDILGKRLVLSDADLQLEGDFVPQILISASTESDGITSFVTIEGPANAPDVTFSSVPELPQEEVLSRLLFGRGLDTISAFQAAQLANAVAVLAGRGGEGLIGRLRKSFGLDDLDVTTAEDGSAALKAGKYISENVYTEVEVGQEGKSQISLNLDVRPGVTLKGRVGADGDTGIGIFLERDY
jgi:translocation and assembly module TamB